MLSWDLVRDRRDARLYVVLSRTFAYEFDASGVLWEALALWGPLDSAAAATVTYQDLQSMERRDDDDALTLAIATSEPLRNLHTELEEDTL